LHTKFQEKDKRQGILLENLNSKQKKHPGIYAKYKKIKKRD
jgi:hypothetical protein